MDVRVVTPALKEDMMAIARPCLCQRGLDDGATVTLPLKLWVRHNILKKSVLPTAAQEIG